MKIRKKLRTNKNENQEENWGQMKVRRKKTRKKTWGIKNENQDEN